MAGPGLEALDGPALYHFTENLGQWPEEIAFTASTSFGSAAFTDKGFYYHLTTTDGGVDVIGVEFVGGGARPVGEGLLEQRSNYLIGEAGSWVTGARSYEAILYRDAWDGVSIRFYFQDGALKYDVGIEAGVSEEPIAFRASGAELTLLEGVLTMKTPRGSMTDGALRSFHPDDGSAVASAFTVEGDVYGFALSGRDDSRAVVIDPVVYSTYVGGGYDKALAVAISPTGHVYAAGFANGNFPITAGAYQTTRYDTDAVVFKMNEAGTALLYATFIGGNGIDQGLSIAVDDAGNAYVSGFTEGGSPRPFPTTTGAYQSAYGGGTYDAFALKLNASGSGLVYSTFIGGPGSDRGLSLGIDASGNSYVAGSTDGGFPTTNRAMQRDYGGGTSDGFILKLNSNGTGLAYSTYIGGGLQDIVYGIAVDGSGRAYVAGETNSYDLPTTEGVFQPGLAGYTDTFAAKLSPSGSYLDYCTYVGSGTNHERAFALDVDEAGCAYITGETASYIFPTTPGAYQQTCGGGTYDAFVYKLSPSADHLVFCTYVGASGRDHATAIAVDIHGNINVAGHTSDAFLTTPGAYQTVYGGGLNDAFFFQLDPTGSRLVYSTLSGGSNDEQAHGIAVDSSRNVFVVGYSASANFPTTSGAFQQSLVQSFNGFVQKYAVLAAPGAPTALIANPGNGQVELSWTQPADNGGANVDYYIVYNGGSEVGRPSSTSFTVTGLTNGKSYSFTVVAHNSVGVGPASSPTTAIPRTVPGAPTGLSATPGDGQVTLSWSAPTQSGGAAVEHYLVYMDGDMVAHPTSTDITILGLTNGKSHVFAVSAVNAGGEGALSEPVSATPRAAPGAPTGLIAAPGNGQVTLEWDEPADDGGYGIDYYVVYQNGVEVSHAYLDWIVIKGLTNGQEYRFTIAAHNAEGTGPVSETVKVTPRTTSGAPSGLTATPGDGRITLTWDEPVNGGAAIDYYIVFMDGVDVAHATTTTAVITGLTNGRAYSFSVAAHNPAGTGTVSPAVGSTPITVPGSPTGLVAVPSNGQITLSWTAPADNGGAAVDHYIVYVDGVVAALPTVTHVTLTGLTNGQVYSLTVTAINLAGESAPQAPVKASPRTVPGAPEEITVTVLDGQVLLSWTVPDDGGAAIDHYVVYWDGGASFEVVGTSTTVTGLTNGQTYRFRVAAHNIAGLGPQTTAVTATPYALPGEPTALSATTGDGEVSLEWTAPSDTGGYAIDYYIMFRDGVDVAHATTTSITLTGLTNGATYSFTVAAHTTAGAGPSSAAVIATPSTGQTVPGVPPTVSVVSGEGLVTLSWAACEGADYYIVYQDGVDVKHVTGAVSTTVSGLTNGQTYSFSVAAHSPAGVGEQTSVVLATPFQKAAGAPDQTLVLLVLTVVVVASAAATVFLLSRGRARQ